MIEIIDSNSALKNKQNLSSESTLVGKNWCYAIEGDAVGSTKE